MRMLLFLFYDYIWYYCTITFYLCSASLGIVLCTCSMYENSSHSLFNNWLPSCKQYVAGTQYCNTINCVYMCGYIAICIIMLIVESKSV